MVTEPPPLSGAPHTQLGFRPKKGRKEAAGRPCPAPGPRAVETGSQGRGPWLENRRQWLGEGKEDRRNQGSPKSLAAVILLHSILYRELPTCRVTPSPTQSPSPSGGTDTIGPKGWKGMVYHHLPIPGTASCWVCLGAVPVITARISSLQLQPPPALNGLG